MDFIVESSRTELAAWVSSSSGTLGENIAPEKTGGGSGSTSNC
eukprot:CAMPEP_0175355480 /NCGR_PEP_ID=MMETSP0095-20121207/13492_1 /TAXON_ID=311494 /ORGANISM="Alexandrium monilatum, Strain CCMP3105" /LENGTH=42 /DNA_ID= /DNA_START= /DNA_END= /DNA_ORIENTATION=